MHRPRCLRRQLPRSTRGAEAGGTTILDFSHCNNSPEHADAALQGLRDAGIRAMFAYGYYPAPSTAGFTDHAQRLRDARRIRERELPSEDALVTMGLALTELGLLPFEQTIAEARSARELAVPSVLHTGCNWGSLVTEGLPELDHHGLLDERQCTCTATPSRSATCAASPSTAARSPRAPRPRSRWAWVIR